MSKDKLARKFAREIKNLVAVSKDPVVINKKAGDVIIKLNDKGSFMYLVLSGKLEISFDGKVIETVMPGGIVGEMSLIDSSIRSATVIAKARTELVPIGKGRFQYLVSRKPEFAFHVMKVMSKRLRKMNESKVKAADKPAAKRKRKTAAKGKKKAL